VLAFSNPRIPTKYLRIHNSRTVLNPYKLKNEEETEEEAEHKKEQALTTQW
jgi:hypothetical protein